MKFYLCLLCGNVIELLDGDANRIKCCNQEMKLLVPNTVEASFEKHIPYCTVDGNKVVVQVGETIHPMDNDHYIMWIAIVKDNKITRVNLKPGMTPIASFDYEEGSIVYAYCNKHGLWMKEL